MGLGRSKISDLYQLTWSLTGSSALYICVVLATVFLQCEKLHIAVWRLPEMRALEAHERPRQAEAGFWTPCPGWTFQPWPRCRPADSEYRGAQELFFFSPKTFWLFKWPWNLAASVSLRWRVGLSGLSVTSGVTGTHFCLLSALLSPSWPLRKARGALAAQEKDSQTRSSSFSGKMVLLFPGQFEKGMLSKGTF